MITKFLSRNLILALLLSSLFLLFVIRKESFETFQLLDFYSATLFLGQLIVIFFILYWPGRAIAEIILRKLTPELKNAVSFGISIFILAILALMIIKFDQIKFIPFIIPILIFVFGLQRGGLIHIYEGVSHIQSLILYLVAAGVWFLSKIRNRTVQYLFLGLFVIEHFYAIWFLQWDIIGQCDICHPWHFATVESFWLLLPLIIIYSLLIVFVFRQIKNEPVKLLDSRLRGNDIILAK